MERIEALMIDFVEDRKGDRQNLRYEQPDQYKVPRYRVAGAGRIIGLDDRYRTRYGSDGRREVLQAGLDPSMRTQKDSLLATPTRSGQVITKAKPRVSDAVEERNQDYISLGKRKTQGSASQKQWQGGFLLRPEHSVSDTDSDTGSSADESKPEDGRAFDDFRQHKANKTNVELLRKIEESPQDVDIWLKLVEHQEALHLARSGNSAALTSSERAIVMDTEISLCETAISRLQRTEDKQLIAVKMMQKVSIVWDTVKQINRWQSLLREIPSFDLELQFLDFIQTNALAFSYEKCWEKYVSCFRKALDLPSESRDQSTVYVLLRSTSFLRDCDFTERAVAIWQSVLEFNFFRPGSLDFGNEISAFETFWESEATRIGEEGAKGWSSLEFTQPAEKSDPSTPELEDADLFKQWQNGEEMFSRLCSLPARTLDSISDPLRVVIFSDITAFIFKCQSRSGAQLLLQAFLQLNNLPLMTGPVFEATRGWWTDPFLANFDLSNPNEDHLESFNPHLPVIGCVPDHWIQFADTAHWFNMWDTGTVNENQAKAWAVRTLMQLTRANPNDDLMAVYSVALQSSISKEKARKYVKSLLRQRPNSLRLYNAYALIECRMNQFAAADRAWSAAIAMKSVDSPHSLTERLLLWHTWVWECLERQDWWKAWMLLLAIPSGKIDCESLADGHIHDGGLSQDNAYITAHDYLRAGAINYWSYPESEKSVYFVVLLAALLYLQSNFNIDAALDVFRDSFDHTTSRDSAPGRGESLHQLRARFLHLHIRLRPNSYKPREVVLTLQESSKLFPDNTLLQALLDIHSQRAGIIDRLRDGFDSRSGLGNLRPSVTSLVLNVSKELSRPSYSGSTSNSIRAAFIRATDVDSPLYRSPGIWRARIEWELSELGGLSLVAVSVSKKPKRQHQPWEKVLNVVYSAIQACPWSKSLYLITFNHELLGQQVRQEELTRLYESMAERGLRIRFDITERVEDMKQTKVRHLPAV